jgi:hypothetical protein
MMDGAVVEDGSDSEHGALPAEKNAALAEWKPRADPGNDVYPVLGLEQIQVWSDGEDPARRTVMRDGNRVWAEP